MFQVKKSTVNVCVEGVREALALVEGLPRTFAAECLPALSLALAEVRELQQLASWLTAHGPAEISAISVAADGCVLRNLSLLNDSAGWPTVSTASGPTVFPAMCATASQILMCIRAAYAAAAAPAVLLETIPTRRCAMRIEPTDAATILHALLYGGARRARRDPLPSVRPTR